MNHRNGEGVPEAGLLHQRLEVQLGSSERLVLGPGRLEESGYGLSRPGWEFRV